MRVALIGVVAGVCAAMCAAQTSAPATKKAPASKTGASKTSTSKAPPTTVRKQVSAAKSAPRTATPVTSASKSAAHGTSKTTAANTRRPVARKSTTPVRTAFRPRQAQPTPERYQEIQNALVAKGYLRPEQATGSWDQNSIDALKRFQAEQKLDASGKITSMSLIALGLGPKHEAAPVAPAALGNQ